MSSVIQYIVANWMQIVVSILAIDAALIPIFPNAGLLKSIQSFLSGVAPKSS